jgi:hypothetical protein
LHGFVKIKKKSASSNSFSIEQQIQDRKENRRWFFWFIFAFFALIVALFCELVELGEIYVGVHVQSGCRYAVKLEV